MNLKLHLGTIQVLKHLSILFQTSQSVLHLLQQRIHLILLIRVYSCLQETSRDRPNNTHTKLTHLQQCCHVSSILFYFSLDDSVISHPEKTGRRFQSSKILGGEYWREILAGKIIPNVSTSLTVCMSRTFWRESHWKYLNILST